MHTCTHPDYEIIEMEARAYLNEPTEAHMTRVLHHATPLIRYFASRLSGGKYGEDLIQCGYEGVIKALNKYNPHKKVAFATYAGHCIMGEIRHHKRCESRYYRPRFIEQLQHKAQIIIEDYYRENGEMPSPNQISETLNIEEQGIEEIMRAGLVSMNELDLNKIISTHYESFRLPVEDRILLYSAINSLSNIKQKVIYYLFFRDYTQKQTAECLGLNQRKISRLLKSSMSDLKAILAE